MLCYVVQISPGYKKPLPCHEGFISGYSCLPPHEVLRLMSKDTIGSRTAAKMLHCHIHIFRSHCIANTVMCLPIMPTAWQPADVAEECSCVSLIWKDRIRDRFEALTTTLPVISMQPRDIYRLTASRFSARARCGHAARSIQYRC